MREALPSLDQGVRHSWAEAPRQIATIAAFPSPAERVPEQGGPATPDDPGAKLNNLISIVFLNPQRGSARNVNERTRSDRFPPSAADAAVRFRGRSLTKAPPARFLQTSL